MIRENIGEELKPAVFEAYDATQVHDVGVESLRAYNEGWRTRAEIMDELKVR